MLQLDAGSREFVAVEVTPSSLLTDFEPSAHDVQMAFVSGEHPDPSDWQPAEWQGRFARCLIGPGGALELSHGLYDVWVRIAHDPELPAKRAGQLRVT